MGFNEFNGKLSPTATASLFRRARVVLAAHGGALTNILFCPENAAILEMGFSTPFAGHYRYLAKSLGLQLKLLPLEADHRGLAAEKVRLADMGAAKQAISDAILTAA